MCLRCQHACKHFFLNEGVALIGDIPTKDVLNSERDLQALYNAPGRVIKEKALPALNKHSRRFIDLSPFFCIGSCRVDGLGDVSPRGGEPGFVRVIDDNHIAFPDRPGNNRLDTLYNIVNNPAVGLLFLVPGIDETLRINGHASVTIRPDLMKAFVFKNRQPRSIVLIETKEVYFHCSKALRRSDLWNPGKMVERSAFPTLGEIARDQFKISIPARIIDLALKVDAKRNLY
jgi:PPOX class probable FMN-dependent enzyme